MFRTILLPLDGSQLAERALPYAKSLAQRAGGRIILVRAEPATGSHSSLSGVEPEGGSVRAQTAAEDYLTDVAIALMGVPVETTVTHDHPGDAILRVGRARHADSIAMTTHGRSGIGRWLYGSVADFVLRRAHLPVLLVPAACEYVWDAAQPSVPRRILIPLDGSPFAEEILTAASQLAGILDAELDVLRVVDVPGALLYQFAEPAADLAEILPIEEEQAHRYVHAMATQLRAAGRVVTPHVVVGWAPAVIADTARARHSCVIAMATHGRSGLARVVLGSVATATLQHAAVPLLLVRPAHLSAEREVEEAGGQDTRRTAPPETRVTPAGRRD